jgi:hypothetical protein
MVRGLKTFHEHYLGFERYYTIIGGTASSIITDEAGIDFRATKDIDIVLIIEMLNNLFVNRFWDFIKKHR